MTEQTGVLPKVEAVIDGLDMAGLLALRAEVDARLVALEADLGAMEATQDGDAAPKDRTGDSAEAGSKRGGGRGIELKRINGCGPYAYERWFEGGVKKSRYIGKAVEVVR